jgi:hypothetical protein
MIYDSSVDALEYFEFLEHNHNVSEIIVSGNITDYSIDSLLR